MRSRNGFTPAQARTLKEVAEATKKYRSLYLAEGYKPREVLHACRFIRCVGFNDFVITDKGLAALAALESEATK